MPINLHACRSRCPGRGTCRHSCSQGHLQMRTPKGSQPLHHDVLVSHCSMTAETNDGAILFVFGDEAAAAAHQTESPPKVEEPAEPKHEQAEPLEQLKSAAQSPPAAQEEASEPEAAYEKTRGKKVKEAVMEAKVKHGAEKSGVFSMLAEAVPLQASQQRTLG